MPSPVGLASNATSPNPLPQTDKVHRQKKQERTDLDFTKHPQHCSNGNKKATHKTKLSEPKGNCFSLNSFYPQNLVAR